MGSLVQDASPFLFPCTIEYSLICAAILYVMWKNISKTGSSKKMVAPMPCHHTHAYRYTRSDENKLKIKKKNRTKMHAFS